MLLLLEFLTELDDLLTQWSSMSRVQTIHTDFWYRPHYVSYDVIKSSHFRPNISETVGDRLLWGAYRKVDRGYRMVTSPMTSC